MNQADKTITGLLFGSFNPVHTGHLIIAGYFVQHTDIESVWFVLSPQNPFKTNEKMLEGSKRLELLNAAIGDNPAFFSCDIELGMATPSYTVNTIRKLQENHPDRQFVLMIGSDNLEDFDQWKDHETILDLVKIYVYPRSAQCNSRFLSHRKVKMFRAPLLEISSTMIREILAQGREPRYLLPDAPLKIIRDKGYYRD